MRQFIKNVRAKTPRKHKRIGIIATAVAGAAAAVAEGGLIDDRPVLRIFLDAVAITAGGIAVNKAQKVQK